MELERRTQVETSEDQQLDAHADCDHGSDTRADESLVQTSFSDAGIVPPVAEEHAEEVAPPQPSASERAFEGRRPPRVGRGAAEPVLQRAASRTVNGVLIVAPAGTRASAIDRVAEIVQLEVGRNKYAQQQLGTARTKIVIIPARTNMTDVSEFSSLKGQKTFDGRDWSGVRGSGGLQTHDGAFAIGVAEENLVNVRGVKSGYPDGYSIAMHELAHALEAKGLTPEQKVRLDALYAQQRQQDARKAGTHHDAFTDNYAAQNKREYFAQATNAFFGKNAGKDKNGRENKNGRAWLQARDPDMYAFLVEMYETRHERSEETAAS